ncbi:hypothetical protein M3172_22270 [Mesobacillus subterraneus]|uniref:hypothetical protein n=1 Tax=Mesobacillus subterraneus TaxID=285983 RepID=UPI00203E77CD|nr:hypothetical protein [Mesobacillus subterraneus]MCM3575899.1 hypothetical protein [Mesobacillus subterraneus]
MKEMLKFSIGVVGVLAIYLGFTDILAKGQTELSDGDKYKTVTVEEQERRENKTKEGKDLTIDITVEEQNRVENSSKLSGFIEQENGLGFFFNK